MGDAPMRDWEGWLDSARVVAGDAVRAGWDRVAHFGQ